MPPTPESAPVGPSGLGFSKLWIYTNYDCNLRCSYCLAESAPGTPRRAIGLDNVRRLVDEAVGLGFAEVHFTGGEPFLLDDIYAMLAYASARLRTGVLTNAMLLRGRRLERLVRHRQRSAAHPGQPRRRDAGRPSTPYRGPRLLGEDGGGHPAAARERWLPGLPEHDRDARRHAAAGRDLRAAPQPRHRGGGSLRPAAGAPGFSTEGLEVSMLTLAPEVTASADGIFWHPLSTDPDMQVSKAAFPLAEAVARIAQQVDTIARTGVAPPLVFR